MQIPPSIPRLLAILRHVKAVFLSPQTPLYVKVVLVLGLFYIISPYDLVPEWVPLIGVMDDLGLAALLIAWANSFSVPKE